MRITAPAKVNLSLHVISRRADGYHQLVTRMQKLDLCDTLEIELSAEEGVRGGCSDPALACDNSNLVVRAARLFLEKSHRLQGMGVRFFLDKRIPMAAGLGGGSSDAGAALRGLNSLAGREFSQQQLSSIGCRLGADVPFFTVDAPAVIASGIGEVMEQVDSVSEFDFLLVYPGIAVSTAVIFQKLVLTTSGKKSKLARSQHRTFSVADLHNDLEKVTFSLYPEVETLKRDIVECGAEKALMSGSGSTVFGLFPKETLSPVEKELISTRLQEKYRSKVFWSREYWGVAKR